MKYLFNSHGKHIANFAGGQLHSTNGKNIGHYLENYKVFIDMKGKYLGEIVFENRLLYNTQNGFQGTNFGVYGNYGNIGNYGNPGNIGSIGSISGFRNIEIESLK